MYQITLERPTDDRSRRTPAVLVVFLQDGERPGMQNLAADFTWRRAVNYNTEAKDAILRKVVANYLKVSMDKVTMKFSPKAGCSMCPCSPGLLAYVEGSPRRYYQPLPAIWVEQVKEQKPLTYG